MFSFNCNSSTTIRQTAKEKTNTLISTTHLKDTLNIGGDFILFLLPDSARFESYDEDSGIYEADSDFGIGISNTLDSFSKNKKYKNIRGLSTFARYILVKDCKDCPVLIDRDTVNYGIILSGKDRAIRTTYNEVHGGNYVQDVDDYFDIKK
jgi:hypothetical protein